MIIVIIIIIMIVIIIIIIKFGEKKIEYYRVFNPRRYH